MKNKRIRRLAHAAALFLLVTLTGLVPAAHAQTGVMQPEQLQSLLAESATALESLRAARKQSVPSALGSRQDPYGHTFKEDMRQNVLPPDTEARLKSLEAAAKADLRTGDLPGAQLTLAQLRAGLAAEIERFKAIFDYWNGVALQWKSGRAIRNEFLRAHGIEPLALSTEAAALETQFEKQIESRNFVEAMRVTRPKYLDISKRVTPDELQQLSMGLESGALEGVVKAVPKRQCAAATETSHSDLAAPRIRDFPLAKDYYPKRLQANGIVGAPVILVIVDSQGCPERALTIASSGLAEMDAGAVQMGVDGVYFPAEVDGAAVRSPVTMRLKFEFR